MTKEETNKWFCEMVGSCEGAYHFYLNTQRGKHEMFDLYKVGTEDWNALTDILIGEESSNIIPNGSKLYIVSNSSFTGERWAKYIKDKSHKRVFNPKEADYIITSNDTTEKSISTLPKSTLLAYTGKGERFIDYGYSDCLNEEEEEAINNNKTWQEIHLGQYDLRKLRGNLPNDFSTYNNYYNCWIFEAGLDILYAKMELNIPVINELSIRDQIIINTALDKETYQTLNAMFNGDEQDCKMAQKIIFDCDIVKSKYWIWKLAKYHRYNMEDNRSKLGRGFQEACGWSKLRYMDHVEILEQLYDTDQLTVEIFAELKVQCLEDITNALNTSMKNIVFDANSILTINEKYKPFDVKSEPLIIELTSLNYKREDED